MRAYTSASAWFSANMELALPLFLCLQMTKYPEVITLDNSDDDDSDGQNSRSRNVGATASVIRGKPLSFSSLQPRGSAAKKLPVRIIRPSQFCRVSVSETSTTQMLQKAFASVSHASQPGLELRNRAMSGAENDTGYIVLSSSRRENSLDSYCYESYDPKAPAFEAQQFNAKFRCSVGNCRMLLSNNVSFMFHLWAHLTEFNYGGGLNCPREMHQLCRCPQCLHIFPTAYRLQIHYDNVHSVTPSSSTCKICEITVDASKHRQIHGDFDAPFHCRKCRYRTSMRTHFIDHFVRFHSNTRTLLCPFCLYSYVIPTDKRSSVISGREYVKHFLLHQEDNYSCNQCSLKFLRHTDKFAHRKEHTQPNLKWISRSIQVHTRRKALLVVCFRAQLLPSLVICNRCKRASCIERDILDHVRGCSGGSCIVVDLKQEKSNIFSQYNDELEMKIFALRPQEKTTRPGNDGVMSNLNNLCRLRNQNSLSPSIVKANMELNDARLHILKRICPRPQFSFADMLRCS
uniref:C2H2-type domain-containing protein n=1 Tax=Elaeophora elaphi TaxID=1147741 RepID=A0A0R3RIS1_9BILA